MDQKIAVLGATGTVGREILQILAERGVNRAQITALASEKSVGMTMAYGEEDDLPVLHARDFDFTTVDIVISTIKPELALQMLPKIAEDGTLVIDTTGAFRTDSDVPMAVPEVSAAAIQHSPKNIIANPESLAILMGLVLKPLHDAAKITRVVASTYQSVSTAGRAAMDELFSQTRAVYVNDPMVKEQFAKQIAFNVIPQTSSFRDDGMTEEEFRVTVDTKKLVDPKIKVAITCAYVPAFLGQGIALTIECENDMDAETARKLLTKAPGVSVVDMRADEGLVTLVEAAGEDRIFVSRIRDDITVDNGISLWIAGDNMRKGSALNAVQIAECWARRKLN